MGDGHIGGAAADINRGHAQGPARLTARLRLAIRAGKGGEKGFGLTVVMGDGLVIEPH